MKTALDYCLAILIFAFIGSLPASATETTGFDIQFPYAVESYTVTSADGTFIAYPQLSEGSKNAVEVAFYGDPFSTVYSGAFTFDAPYDAVLIPGLYSGATRYPFESFENPGFDIGFNSQGFDELQGAFTILQLVYGPDGSIQHFGASFLDHNNNQGDVGFTGHIYYNYDAATVPEPQSMGFAVLGLFCVGFFSARSRPRKDWTSRPDAIENYPNSIRSLLC